ncbi:MAG: HDOD domain-containing protein [Gammaproteobacteria bacterium]
MNEVLELLAQARAWLHSAAGAVDVAQAERVDQLVLLVGLPLVLLVLFRRPVARLFGVRRTQEARPIPEALRQELAGLGASMAEEPDDETVGQALDELETLMSRHLHVDAVMADPWSDASLRGLFISANEAPVAAEPKAGQSPGAPLVQRLLSEISEDLAADRLQLPPLPDEVIRIRQVITDPNSSNDAIARAIEGDPALGARVLKIVNSARFAGYESVADLPTAVARLGHRAMEDIVLSAYLGQMFEKSHNPIINGHLKKLWGHSRDVAALAFGLARRVPNLDPQVALLAGLIHEIGAVPVLLRLEDEPDVVADPATLSAIVAELAPMVGRGMLTSWHFPPTLIAVAGEYDRLERDSGEQADYADVVLVAKLVALVGQEQWSARERPVEIPALRKLGLSLDGAYADLGGASDELLSLREGLPG